jgi:hypothetical protein
MKDTHAADELDRLGGLIENNIGLEASDNLGQWSDRFQTWAQKLEPKSSGGGSSSGGQPGADLTEQLIALLRLRESEINVREETSILDQDKGPPESYLQRAGVLAGSQEQLGGELDRIHEKTPVPQLDSAFADSARAMQVTLALLRQPQTGKPADDAEVMTIDSLSDLINLINEQAQRSSPKSSPGQSGDAEDEMQFLMQLTRNPGNTRGFANQPNRGLTSGGGAASSAGGPLSGEAAGKGPGSRSVSQAAGAIQNAPAEFRDALENYYHGLEQSKE